MCVKDIIENVVQRSKKLSYDEHPIQCILRNIGLMDQYITAKQCCEMAHISYFAFINDIFLKAQHIIYNLHSMGSSALEIKLAFCIEIKVLIGKFEHHGLQKIWSSYCFKLQRMQGMRTHKRKWDLDKQTCITSWVDCTVNKAQMRIWTIKPEWLKLEGWMLDKKTNKGLQLQLDKLLHKQGQFSIQPQ